MSVIFIIGFILYPLYPLYLYPLILYPLCRMSVIFISENVVWLNRLYRCAFDSIFYHTEVVLSTSPHLTSIIKL